MLSLEDRRLLTLPLKLERLGTALFIESFDTENKKSKLLTETFCQKIISQDVHTSVITKQKIRSKILSLLQELREKMNPKQRLLNETSFERGALSWFKDIIVR